MSKNAKQMLAEAFKRLEVLEAKETAFKKRRRRYMREWRARKKADREQL